MGIDGVLGDRKRRKAERETGLTIDRVLAVGHETWEARVLVEGGHRHYRIDTRTWRHDERQPLAYGGCWSSCAELPPERAARLMPETA